MASWTMDTNTTALASNTLGDLARASGRYEETAQLYQGSLALVGEEGPQGWRALYLHNLGHATSHLTDEQQARALFAEALARYQDVGDRRGVLECVAGLAGLVADRDPERTARLVGGATAIADAMGTRLSQLNRTGYVNSLATAHRRLGDAAFEAAWEQGRSLTLELAIAEAMEECRGCRSQLPPAKAGSLQLAPTLPPPRPRLAD
jgi:tetratricopeptide (TPR) repeat protein